MRDLDLTSLRLFVAVCDTRNIARAAEQQALVGSAISKRLAALEDAVGTALLVRRRRGVEPTPAGETLLEHAREILANHARIERDMAAYAAGVRGQVRILATASAIAESLADFSRDLASSQCASWYSSEMDSPASTAGTRLPSLRTSASATSSMQNGCSGASSAMRA